MEKTKILLSEKDLPTHFYNILPDLPKPLEPPLDPKTGKPIGPEELSRIFPKELIKQEMSMESKIEIPEEVREIYKLYRPTPLFRAKRLEKFLKTPAHIYYKYEGQSPVGSHKPNTALVQAYYNKKEGVKRLTTETGAGQWGSALAMACNFFDLECTVYMVKCSYEQKPYRRTVMQIFGAKVFPSPSQNTKFGKKILKENPEHPGSLGVAISEAIEDAVSHENTKYSLGSVLNHVLLHQTIVGLEAKKQMEMVDEYPDIVIGCIGGGSNFAGLSFPFLKDKLRGKKKNLMAIAVEPTACPSITKGIFAYDYGDTAGVTPLLKMYTLGHRFIPNPVHAGGLRYHGKAPIISLLCKEGFMEARAYSQLPVFKAAVDFARCEGIIPAPESSYAIKAAIDEALKCKKEGIKKTILFNLSGHGLLDLAGYEKYLAGKLEDYKYPKEKVKEALKYLPKI
jgi:tryptophan synthase beta chain